MDIELGDSELLNRYVKPHRKISREILLGDVDRVVKESVIMWKLCFQPVGLYKSAYAVHHSQIDDIDPLDFFTTADRRIIINPIITRHSNYFVDSEEGCLTYAEEKIITVKRWRKIDVTYVTIMVDSNDESKFTLTGPIKEKLTGQMAWVFQHEISHGQGKYIYDELIINE